MKKLSVLAAAFFLIATMVSTSTPNLFAQHEKGWKVWVKTSPCSGLYDWVSVAQRNPGEVGGGSYWTSADLVIADPNLICTHPWSDCTFAAANSEKEIVKASGVASGKFAGYCCREYSVWEHVPDGKLSIVMGKPLRTSNYPWRLVKPDLCCLEAEALAGLPGACSGPTSRTYCFGSDVGAGSLNRDDHYKWAQNRDATRLETNLKSKIERLYNCSSVSDDAFANAFADFSVVIAQNSNANCFNNDPGAVTTNRNSHYQWARRKTRQQLFENLQWKIVAAFRCLDTHRQKTFFADLSMPIARTSPTTTGGNRGPTDDGNRGGGGEGGGVERPKDPKGNCDPAIFSLVPGTWQSEWGPVTLSGTCDRITGYWVQSASMRGEITGGSFDSNSRTLTFSYKQSWNNVTDGRASLRLSANGKTLDGRYSGGGGNGSWTMHK